MGVVDQRHDGVKIRRGRQFDLAALGRGPVLAQDNAEHLIVHVKDGVLFLLGEFAALGAELLDDGKALRGGKAGPLEIVERLEVAEIGVGELADDTVELGQGVTRAALGQELGVPGHRTDEGIPIDFEEIFEEMAAVLVVKIGGGPAAERSPLVLDLTVDQFKDLPHEHRSEVEITRSFG